MNYNQRVKTLNTLAKFRDRQGRMIVSRTDIEHDMTDMKRMMDSMVSKVGLIEKEVTDFIKLSGAEGEDDGSAHATDGVLFDEDG